VNESGTSSSKGTIPAKKPVRKQPKGLRMRFLPIGFGEGDAGELGFESSEDSDLEIRGAPNDLKTPMPIDTVTLSKVESKEDSKKPRETVDISSNESLSSDSHREMARAPPLPLSTKTVTVKPPKTSKVDAPAQIAMNGVKRKHKESSGRKAEKKSKNSSS
jgi:hypothetical protein